MTIRLSASISMLFDELPLEDRIPAAARAGFAGVECAFPYALDPVLAREQLDRHGLEMVLINSPAGDWAKGDRGLAVLPALAGEFRRSAQQAVDLARATNCKSIHAIAGLAEPEDGAATQTYVENLRYFADLAAGDGIAVLIEPVNTRIDMPGYYLRGLEQAQRLIADIEAPNLRLLFDAYHIRAMDEEPCAAFEIAAPLIGHIQIADYPGRHEPGTGRIDYDTLFRKIDARGYQGWIGCEYRPSHSTSDSLRWAKPFLSGRME